MRGQRSIGLLWLLLGAITGLGLYAATRADRAAVTRPPAIRETRSGEGLAEPRETPAPRALASVGIDRPEAPRAEAIAEPRAVEARVARRAAPRAPVARYSPRPAEEWQGMQVDLSTQPSCDGESSCGLAMACLDHHCGPCRADAECAGGEVCVLDHCVRAANARCRGARECGAGRLCVLSGYSPDVRGNRDMRAECLALEGGEERETTPDPIAIDTPVVPPPISVEALRDTDAAGVAGAEAPEDDAL